MASSTNEKRDGRLPPSFNRSERSIEMPQLPPQENEDGGNSPSSEDNGALPWPPESFQFPQFDGPDDALGPAGSALKLANRDQLIEDLPGSESDAELVGDSASPNEGAEALLGPSTPTRFHFEIEDDDSRISGDWDAVLVIPVKQLLGSWALPDLALDDADHNALGPSNPPFELDLLPETPPLQVPRDGNGDASDEH